MGARLLFRLDDACPRHDRERWARVETLFDTAGIKPLVAVIPDNADQAFATYPEDQDYQNRVAGWQDKGWLIGLHGCTHVLKPSKRGLVPFNSYSEFTGLALDEQTRLIERGYQALCKLGLLPKVWVAPAHGFDRNTLIALAAATPIRVISDGIGQRAFRRYGFTWVPQQLWKPRTLKSGLWTVCLHPNEMKDAEFEQLAAFIKQFPALCASWDSVECAPVLANEATVPSYTCSDWLFSAAYLGLRRVRSLGKKSVAKAGS